MTAILFAIAMQTASGECVESGLSVDMMDASERPANGLPTLGTLLMTIGGSLELASIFTALLGTFAALDRGGGWMFVVPVVAVSNAAALVMALLGLVTAGAGVFLYVYGWQLAAEARGLRRCRR